MIVFCAVFIIIFTGIASCLCELLTKRHPMPCRA
jgi:hypothetical protein